MTDILAELRAVQNLRGATFSSDEVIGYVGQAADEIERLNDELAMYQRAALCHHENAAGDGEKIERLTATLDTLARAADTAELLLQKDYPAEAQSLRVKIAAAKRVHQQQATETK